MKNILVIGLLMGFIFSGISVAYAQEETVDNTSNGSSSEENLALDTVLEDASTTATLLQEKTEQINTKDKTKPEELPEKVAILSLFASREVTSPGFFSFMAYWVQEAVKIGIPANTIFLILLTPILAMLVSLVRVVIGLPTLDMLVPIALAFVFVAVGISVGMIVLCAIILAAYVSKMSLMKLRIMFYPKRSLSILFLAIFVFAALTVALLLDFEQVLNLSIFPILILMLLGDSIVSVQLTKSISETFLITSTTIVLGLLGFALASSEVIRDTLILYPEIVLFTIPVNLVIGRYFGLRVLEYFRFEVLSD